MTVSEATLRGILQATAGQIEPHLSRLEEAIEEPVEAGAFALGMLTAGLVFNQVDVIELAGLHQEAVLEFLAQVRLRQAKDLGPYRQGRLTGPYERVAYGQVFPAGTLVRYRAVNDTWAEIMLPDSSVRWVHASIVEPFEPDGEESG